MTKKYILTDETTTYKGFTLHNHLRAAGRFCLKHSAKKTACVPAATYAKKLFRTAPTTANAFTSLYESGANTT